MPLYVDRIRSGLELESTEAACDILHGSRTLVRHCRSEKSDNNFAAGKLPTYFHAMSAKRQRQYFCAWCRSSSISLSTDGLLCDVCKNLYKDRPIQPTPIRPDVELVPQQEFGPCVHCGKDTHKVIHSAVVCRECGDVHKTGVFDDTPSIFSNPATLEESRFNMLPTTHSPSASTPEDKRFSQYQKLQRELKATCALLQCAISVSSTADVYLLTLFTHCYDKYFKRQSSKLLVCLAYIASLQSHAPIPRRLPKKLVCRRWATLKQSVKKIELDLIAYLPDFKPVGLFAHASKVIARLCPLFDVPYKTLLDCQAQLLIYRERLYQSWFADSYRRRESVYLRSEVLDETKLFTGDAETLGAAFFYHYCKTNGIKYVTGESVHAMALVSETRISQVCQDIKLEFERSAFFDPYA